MSTDTSTGDIETLAGELATTRDRLRDRVAALESDLAAVRERHLPEIRRLAAAATDAHARLAAEVDARRGLFVRPKTRVLHGIKVGLRKAPGRVEWDDAAKVVSRIGRIFPDRFDDLVKTVRSPIKAALGKLPATDLKRLGVTVGADGEEVVVAATDREIDALVDALIAGAGGD